MRWAPNRTENDALIGRCLVDQLWSLASLDVINVELIYWFFNQMHSNPNQTNHCLAWSVWEASYSRSVDGKRMTAIQRNRAFEETDSNRIGKTHINVISYNLKCHWHQVLQEPKGDIKSSDILEISVLLQFMLLPLLLLMLVQLPLAAYMILQMGRIHVDIDRYQTNESTTERTT